MSPKAQQNKKNNYKTTKSERISYGIYFYGQLTFYALVTGFLQLYMTESGIPALLVGGIFIVAKIWDAINDPLFGVIVDKAHMKKGKYIPWVCLSTFLIPAATIFLFSVPAGVSVQVKAIWAAVGYMLWDTSYTICDVPIFALATSMTDNLEERNGLYMLNRFFMFVGSLAVSIIVPVLYPNIGWTATVIIMAVIAMATMLPIGYKAKERYYTEDGEKSPKIKELFGYLGRNKQLLLFNGALIVASLSNTSAAVGSYFAIYCLGGSEWISIMALVVSLPMLISIVVAQQVIKKIDKFTVYMFCQGMNIILGVILYFVGYSNIPIFIAFAIVRSIFGSASGILLVMFTADCAEYGHYITGDRAQGMAFSVQTFTAKITAALSSAIGMFVLGSVGFVEGAGAVQTTETIAWIWRMYTLIPLFAGSVAFLMLLFGYKLRNHDVKIMMLANAGEISREEAEKSLSRKYT